MSVLVDVAGFVLTTSVRFAPLFLLSIGLAAVVKALPIADVASRWLARREGVSVVAGAALGSFSPFCSCTVVPVVRSLLVAGAPLAGVMAFWVASPLMDPEVFALSVGLLGWELAVARVLAALALSLAAGFGAIVAVRRGWLSDGAVAVPATGASCSSSACGASTPTAEEPVPASSALAGDASTTGRGTALLLATVAAPDDASGCGGGEHDGCEVPDRSGGRQGLLATLAGLDWRQVRDDVRSESWGVGRWMLLAFAMEALILRFVPQEAMVAVLGQDAPWAVPLAALLGVPLYLDNVSALPIISGLLEQGMAPGAAIAFLVAGPVTTIPAMTAVRAVLPGPIFRYYLAVGLVGAAALGVVADVVL